jgi:signal transduction histidine kinase
MSSEHHQTGKKNLDRLDSSIRTLNKCYRAYFYARNEQELLQSICDIVVSHGEFELVWIGYCEHNRENLVRTVAKAGAGISYLDEVKFSWEDGELGQGPVGIAIRTQQPCWINDIRFDARFAPWRAAALARGFSSCLAIPLVLKDEATGSENNLHGTFILYSARPSAFDERNVEYFIDLASYLTIAVLTMRRDLADQIVHGTVAVRAREEGRRARQAQRAAREEIDRVTRLMTTGAVAAAIVHEINQPLGAIALNGYVVEQQLMSGGSNDIREARSAVEAIISDAHRAGEIVASIRAMFKQTKPEMAPVNLNEIISEVIGAVSNDLLAQRVATQQDLLETLPFVLGDRVQLRQVIFNLLKNAIEAMSLVTDRPRVLRVHSSTYQIDSILLTVEDSGIGIDQKNIDRLFDSFYTTKSLGMGIGLSLCRSIVAAHNGRLLATPGVQNGSIFQLFLPISYQMHRDGQNDWDSNGF